MITKKKGKKTKACIPGCISAVIAVFQAVFIFILSLGPNGVRDQLSSSDMHWLNTSKISKSTTKCGDWTPFGNLGNPQFNSTYREPILSRDVPSCAKSLVGKEYEPDSSQLFCHPPLRGGDRSKLFHRDPAILRLDLQLRPNEKPELFPYIAKSQCCRGSQRNSSVDL